MFEAFAQGVFEAAAPFYLLMTVIGVIIGLIISAVPGLTISLAVVLLLPFTYYLSPGPSLAMLVGVFISGMAGGAVPAILINIPGNPAAVVTNLDGFPLANKGKPELALGIAIISSILGACVGLLVLVTLAPAISKFAIHFRAPELFALILLGLSLVCGFSQSNMIKGFIAAALGLLVATVGLDPIEATQRFTFGSPHLQRGIDFMPVMIGLFAIPEVLNSIGKSGRICEVLTSLTMSNYLKQTISTFKEIPKLLPTILKSSIIGSIIGAIPGTGSAIAAVLGYESAKRSSKHPEEFGKGSLEGISAPEAANTSMCGGALVPMLTLGIPGDPVTAVMLGALMIQGLNPGPLLFMRNIDLVYTFFGSYFIAIPVTLVIAMLAIPLFVKVIKFPAQIIMPIILLLSIVGSYTLQRNIVDVWLMFMFGLLGYVMLKFDYPILPLLLGIILGTPFEDNFRMSLLFSEGSLLIFFQRPTTLVLLIITAIYVFYQMRSNIQLKKKAASS